jgi:signal transduction histidine kinase
VVQSFELDLAIEDFISPALFWAGAWVIGDNRRTNQIRAAQEREQAERDRELTIAEERTRIARELHDSAGHAITNILVQAGAARVLHERDPVGSREALLAIEDLARETLGDIDRIVGALREGESAPLVPLPGIDGIGDLVERHRAGGLDFNLKLHGDPGSALPQPVERTAYRIAQEALTNAARHGTGTAELVVEYGPAGLELVVTNPVRVGAPQARPGGGRGIIGMRERALLLGGSLEATPVGDRFRVRAELPYDRD